MASLTRMIVWRLVRKSRASSISRSWLSVVWPAVETWRNRGGQTAPAASVRFEGRALERGAERENRHGRVCSP